MVSHKTPDSPAAAASDIFDAHRNIPEKQDLQLHRQEQQQPAPDVSATADAAELEQQLEALAIEVRCSITHQKLLPHPALTPPCLFSLLNLQ
jgi:hypothetical protein